MTTQSIPAALVRGPQSFPRIYSMPVKAGKKVIRRYGIAKPQRKENGEINPYLPYVEHSLLGRWVLTEK